MKPTVSGIACLLACGGSIARAQTPVDSSLAAFIGAIRAVDNHSHVNTVAPDDSEADALPPEVLLPFSIPLRLRPESPEWLAAYRGLYGYPYEDLSEAHLREWRGTGQRSAGEQGENFPSWVLERIGTEVMLANRVAMGPGLGSPRFRWVSYVDALLLPLSTAAEAAASPDRGKLYRLEARLLRRYVDDLGLAALPATLDAYLTRVVTPTLERQRTAGCVAVKFEAALLRALDFDAVRVETARRIYARYVGGGEPSHAEYKALQDFLFRYIARQAGRLGMALHLHSFEGPGDFYRAEGSDPLLLESVFNDPGLRGTDFVIVHGGGFYAAHAGAMLWKPNVYVDMSAMTLIYTPAQLAGVLRDWLLEYPEKVLFGTDAAAFGPELGWELAAWIGTTTARRALAVALSDMMRNGEVSRAHAEAIATMVMRTNAGKLYNLPLR